MWAFDQSVYLLHTTCTPCKTSALDQKKYVTSVYHCLSFLDMNLRHSVSVELQMIHVFPGPCWLRNNQQPSADPTSSGCVPRSHRSHWTAGLKRYIESHFYWNVLLYPLLQQSWKRGILVSYCLSVHPSVDGIVSTLYPGLCIFNKARWIHFIFIPIIWDPPIRQEGLEW